MDASRKRLFLAGYIDFLLFASVFYLFKYFLGVHGASYSEYLVPLILAIIAFLLRRISPGRVFVSISHDNYVPEYLKRTENFWTMGIALFFVLDGTKQCVRWTQFTAWPFWGMLPEGVFYAFVSMMMGVAFITAGYWVFKLKKKGLFLSAGLILFQMGSVLASTRLWNDAVARKVIERRDLQGLSADQELIHFMQKITVPGLLSIGVILLLILFLNKKRFS